MFFGFFFKSPSVSVFGGCDNLELIPYYCQCQVITLIVNYNNKIINQLSRDPGEIHFDWLVFFQLLNFP